MVIFMRYELKKHLHCGFYDKAITVTWIKEIHLSYWGKKKIVHLKTLLTSLNTCLDRMKKLRNMIEIIYYIVLSKIKKIVVLTKIFNINALKKVRCNMIRKLKQNSANNTTYLSCSSVGLMTSVYEFNFMKKIKIPRAENCDVVWQSNCLQKMTILWLYDYNG